MPRRPPSAAADLIPEHPSLDELRSLAAACQACDLYRHATQTVFGEGGPGAEVMLVGEQPGDREDVEGEPFVGPSGRLLDQGLAQAGIDRTQAYVTNVVKHFKWTPRGKARLHKTPTAAEIWACRPWLEAELAVVRPQVLVALGATAAKALFGSGFRVSRQRGQLVESPLAPAALATVHPSSILRVEEPEQREGEYERFVADLSVVASVLAP